MLNPDQPWSTSLKGLIKVDQKAGERPGEGGNWRSHDGAGEGRGGNVERVD